GRDKIIGLSMPEGGRYLLLTVLYGSAARKSEVYVKDVVADGPITPVVNDIDARFTGRIGGDTLFLPTHWNAPNNRLLAVSLRDPARDKWKEIVPEGPSVMQGFGLVGGRVYVTYLENVASAQKIFLPDGTPAGAVKYPGAGSGGVNGRWDRNEAFFSF